MVAGINEGKMSSKRLIKVRHSQLRHALTCITTWYLFLKKYSDHVKWHVEENDVAHYEGTEIVDKLLELKSFIVEQLPTTHIVISHPIMRTDSKNLATKIGQSHLRKLQIDMIENGNINSNI